MTNERQTPWWLFSALLALASMVYATIVACIPYGWPTVVALIGPVVFVVIFLRNPKLFYRRMFAMIAGAWLTIGALSFISFRTWIQSHSGLSISIVPSGPVFHICAVALLVVLLVLDFLSRHPDVLHTQVSRQLFSPLAMVATSAVSIGALALSIQESGEPRAPAGQSAMTDTQEAKTGDVRDDSNVVVVQDSPNTNVSIGADESRADLVIELDDLLHDRARKAFRPISAALNDPNPTLRRQVLEFKKEWVRLEIDLNQAVGASQFSKASEIASDLKALGNRNIARWSGPTPSELFFKSLPSGLVERLTNEVAESTDLLQLFDH